MALSDRYLRGAGTLKLPEFNWDYVDGLQFTVAAAVSKATVDGGTWDLQTTATLDVAGVDAWPAAGCFYINGRIYTYASISDDSFIGCEGPFGDLASAAIAAGEIGRQAALPATVANAILGTLGAFMPHVAKDDSVTPGRMHIAGGSIWDSAGNVKLSGVSAVADGGGTTTLYWCAYNLLGSLEIGYSSSWAFAEKSAAESGSCMIPIAEVTYVDDEVTAIVDCRPLVMPQTPAWVTLYKAVDTPQASNDILTMDAELVPSNFIAGASYVFRGSVYFETTVNAGFKFSFSPSDTFTRFRAHISYSCGTSGAFGTDAVTEGVDIAYDVTHSIAAPSPGTGGHVEFDGIFTVDGGGLADLYFMWAQATSHTDVTKVLAGSYLEFKRVA